MNRFYRWLIRWGLGYVDARVLLSELEETHLKKRASEGRAAADRWIRSESRRAGLRAAAFRFGFGSSRGRSEEAEVHPASSMGATLGGIAKDAVFGVRILLKRPLFSLLVIGTLGLGIGASTTVFSLVDGVLLKDLPFQRSGELVNIWKTFPGWRGQDVLDEAWDKIGLRWPEYLNLKDGTRVLQDLGIHKARNMTLTGSGEPLRLVAGEANPALFPMLGIPLALGRGFDPGEEGPGSPRVAILDNSLWRSRFGSDPGILGHTIQLDDEGFQVIGVLAADVRIPSTIRSLLESDLDGGDRALWVPIGFDLAPPQAGNTGSQDIEAVGRLVPGATVDQLMSELDAFVRDGRSEEALGFRLKPMKEEIIGGHRASLNLLLAASGLLLLIACVNTAALLMSEAVGRRHEMATRVALGAGRGRVVRQLLTESVILGLLGSALGLAMSFGGIRGFLALAPSLPRLEEVAVNQTVLLFAVLAGVGTGVLFGLVPALTLRGESIHSIQTGSGRGATKRGGRFQQGLLAVELALTLVLLVSGGLLTRSLVKLSAVDPGFDGNSVATVRVYLPHPEGSGPDREFFYQIMARVREIPGVEEAGGIDGLPFPGRVSGSGLRIDTGGEESVSLISRDHVVTPGYFETMKARILAGRSFLESDAGDGAVQVMVINDLLAKRYWPGASPLGSRVELNGRGYEVVGVVEDVLERHLAEDPKPMVYVVGPELSGGMSVVARGSGDVRSLAGEMRRAIWALDPDLPVTQESTVPALVKSSTSAERYRTALVLVFGLLATALASIGVFGITAHTVSKRSREMGIRMAMGAEGAHLIRTVVSETLIPGILGVGLGLMGALAAARLLSSYLFGVEAWDLPTYAFISLLLTILASVAAAIPAARASRVDPVQVLREE